MMVPLAATLLLGILAGCLDWPPFSSNGRRNNPEVVAALMSPAAENSLIRLRTEYERLRPGRTLQAANDPNVVLFAEVLGRVVAEYVRPVEAPVLIDAAITGLQKAAVAEKDRPADDRALMETAIGGMLATLDPYSSYLNPENYRNMQAQTHGEFGGLGIEVTLDQKTGYVRVVTPIDGTPASEAGLRSGDLITHVDGVPVQGMSLIQAVFRMRGPIGTAVRLTLRTGETVPPREVSLVRSTVKLHPVQSRLEGDVGYIRVTTFNERTATELEEAVAHLKKTMGKRLAGLVLDLRNNPGGLLDQAIAVADDFIDHGEIVAVRGRRPQEGRHYQASGESLGPGLPLVVLINGGSASASEIVAAALQDHRRALVFGTRSYGKGSVQTVSPLPDEGALRLTTARYYRPAGTSVDCVGVLPDLEVKSPQAEGRTEEPHQDPATCGNGQANGLAPAPATAQPRLRTAEICPGVEDKPAEDAPLRCAVTAIQSRKIIGR
ncbi:carboxyl-terminal processing protease [Azospirillaceae bacterium]